MNKVRLKCNQLIKKTLEEILCNGDKVLIDIKNATVLKGIFPFKQLKLVLAWCEIHKEELLKNWKLAQEYEKINKIEPLR